MKAISRILLLASLAVASAFTAAALDLPVKKIKGQQYYYYKVQKNESIYGLSKRFGLTREEIVRHNPSAADGLKKNMMLYFPYEEYAEHVPVDPDVEVVEVAEVAPELPATAPRITVMMPFNLDSSVSESSSKMALEFYKGLLIAADSLASRGGQHIEICVYDTRNDPAAVRTAMATDTILTRSAVIIAPDDAATLNAIGEIVRGSSTYVLNVLNFRDTTYLTNPNMMLANIPQQLMYETAVKGLRMEMPDYTPVIIRSATGRNDKESFTAYLTESYRADGIEPIEIEYNTNLLSADLDVLPTDAGQKYVVIPSSGSLAEFNKFAHVLKSMRDRMAASEFEDNVAEPAHLAVFGYPDWTAFRGDAQDLLHKLEATIFSRFYDDFNGFGARNIEADFKYWYGSAMTESIPSTGIMGFDAGTYLIKNLRANDGQFSPTNPESYSGIQSTFRFERVSDEGGYVNTALYLIHYLPTGRMSARVL
ncbi:MAG: LysM peptidoglycan-binding domain-containing protein [Bacteroidales bacterium]|nr:LysM peptidoglycan-binding domain-containing protein [Bacteroidales bacterium]